MKKKLNDLLKISVKAKEFSYSPYSKFRVGAAAEADNSKIYSGCNVENSSYGLSNCAERTAIFKGISEGVKSFTHLAISSDTEEFCPPCGACRQVMSEFMKPDSDIILVNKNSDIKQFKLKDLLPHSFHEKFLDK